MHNNKERGFILITALVLLSIITLLGTTAAFKAVIETKVSRMSGAGSQAFMVANAGLQKQFLEWGFDAVANGGQDEFTLLLDDINNAGVSSGIYLNTITPFSIDDLRTNHAGGNIDNWVQTTANLRVYELSATGMSEVANSTWNGAGKQGVQQVAVWATSFETPADPAEYPYLTPNTIACKDCSLVVYALGRFGATYRMARQTMSKSAGEGKLQGVSAMTNAPAGGDFAKLCDPTTGSTTANGNPWHTAAGVGDKSGGNGTALIEATQAPYTTGVVPSGVALASNVALGVGGKGFRDGQASKTGANFSSTPYIVYSGHDAYSSYKVDWADEDIDQNGTELPAGKIPQDLVKSPLLGTTDEVKYFSGGNNQLFTMDAYRWGAEQFTCQDTTKNDGEYGNGIYCSKAEALRLALDKQMGGDGTGTVVKGPITGRLTIAQIQYNISNAIPMFGLVRLMFPADVNTDKPGSTTCNGKTVVNHAILGKNANDSQWGDQFDKLMYKGGAYTGSLTAPVLGKFPFTKADGAVVDKDGDLGPNGRFIVYGTLLIDYFADYDIENTSADAAFAYNTVYDPDQGERLLDPLESVDVYLAIEYNMMINPVLPKFGTNTPLAFATAATKISTRTPAVTPSRLGYADAMGGAGAIDLTATGKVNMYDANAGSSKKINLASPYDGVFPYSEGMMPRPVGEGDAGINRMMELSSTGGGLLAAATASIGTKVTALNAEFKALLSAAKPYGTAGTDAQLIKYYYELMVATTKMANHPAKLPNDNIWPVAAWPTSDLSETFCIGKKDCANGNHMGDKMHLMFPSGYAHAWKVALAALDMTANEWNHLLTGAGPASTRKGIADASGLYAQIKNKCSQYGLVVGGGCASGYPYNLFAVTTGYNSLTTQDDVQSVQDAESTSFYITTDTYTGYGLLDGDWKDIPSTMYSGGLLDMHAHSNMNGIIYTPGPLEWEPGNSDYDSGKTNGHLSYISGSIITGFGASVNNKKGDENSHLILVFDPLSVDNVPVKTGGDNKVILRRYAWQGLR